MEDRIAASAAEVFDELGGEYERAFAGLPGQREALRWLMERLPAGASVLDVGSGTGRPVAATLADSGFRVTGIDVSATMVELARSRVPGGDFRLADVRTFAPAEPFDAVCAFFPLLLMPQRDVVTSLERIASWVAPGGYLLFATVPGDLDETTLTWMGRRMNVSSLPAGEFAARLEELGLTVLHRHTATFQPDSSIAGPEEHLFLHARRTGRVAPPAHALLGPYPHPARYRGPHALSTAAWAAFEPHFRRHDVDSVVEALTGCRRILDVGGGTGAGVRAIAARHGSCTTVEPNRDREAAIQHLPEHGVTVHPGRGERLPFPDGAFDAVTASWVLHYTDDPEAAVREMLRVLDRDDPHARVVLVQGTPDNHMVELLNRHCVVPAGEQVDHQGHLLHLAARQCVEAGLTDISYRRADAALVPDPGAPDRQAAQTARILADFWHAHHPDNPAMRASLEQDLLAHYGAGHQAVDDGAVLLTARRP
ncbi:methyltransferase domain-containing protein [Streptomyces sp. NPDC058734]|uniref:methyltransferase domain-containing protein n=1 Tax=Streptomyces sp. NPDC058734 TaxID=3346615 RepID=UPI0036B587F3